MILKHLINNTDRGALKRRKFVSLILSPFVLLTALPGTATAFSGGISGCSDSPDSMATCSSFTGTQVGSCSNCHSGGVEPTVSLSGPTTVMPGSTHTYTFTIMGGQQVAGGLNVSTDAGILMAADSNTRVQSGEVTHSSPLSVDENGNVVFTFDWTAPDSGMAVLYAAGNSVNRDSNTSGDSASSTSLTVAVEGSASQPDVPLTANAGGPYEAITGTSITFDGSGSRNTGGDIVSYDWDFGDGSTGTGEMPSHSYVAAGTYTVALTVMDESGMSHTASTTAQVNETEEPSVPLFGGYEDVRFAKLLWWNMRLHRLVGPRSIHTVPYIGTEPHGAVLETLDGVYRIRGLFRGGIKGALIVKKNYVGDDVTPEKVANDPDSYLGAITVMFKRRGYDPENQDWFWVRYEPNGEIAENADGVPLAGRVAKGMSTGCIACHSAAPGGDYVFIHDRYADTD